MGFRRRCLQCIWFILSCCCASGFILTSPRGFPHTLDQRSSWIKQNSHTESAVVLPQTDPSSAALLTTVPDGLHRSAGSSNWLSSPNSTTFTGAGAGVGQQHFGDIMGGGQPTSINLHDFAPLERIVLTSNANLQRIISAYYNSPVEVNITKCDLVGEWIFDRSVTLSVAGVNFCVAQSTVQLHSEACISAVQNSSVGIGQLFRYLDTLPSFTLLGTGQGEHGEGMWRDYLLESKHLSCRIHETFHPNLFGLRLQKEEGQAYE